MDYGRINNTIMHEIGHIVLDHSEDSELAEKEVRFFAKYALVPPVLVHKLKLNDPYDIAGVFDVSFEAACYALSYEADVNYYEGRRNRHRVLWSNDGLIFVTYDHYSTFYEIT